VSDPHEERRRLAEQAVVLRAQAGDRAAFHELVEQYQKRLTYFVHRLVGSGETANDLLQEVWLEVFRKLGRLESPAAFRVWLYQIAHHRAVAQLRRKNAESRAQQRWVELSGNEAAVDEAKLLEDLELVHHALGQLSLEHREALTLRFIEGMSVGDIARVTECNEGTAKSRLHYAKLAMRKIIEEERGR
jgi:RNA polymerase sigma-70 factor (ECF subfamily)